MFKKLLLLTVITTFVATTAEAYPGNRIPGYPPGNGRPRPNPGPRPMPPQHPNPRPPMQPDPGYGTLNISIPADRYMHSNDRIDISQYIDMAQYRGYRLVSIDFSASSRFNSAIIDVYVNGYQIAPTINLNSYHNNFRLAPNQNTYLGYGADNIVILGSGELYISNIILQLSR